MGIHLRWIRQRRKSGWIANHPRSKGLGKIQGHHQGRTICLPRTEHGKRKLGDFQSVLSCCAHPEIVCVCSGRRINGALFLTDCHDDFATTNETIQMRDDGAEDRSNTPTWLWDDCLTWNDDSRVRWLMGEVCARTLFAGQQRGQLRLG